MRRAIIVFSMFLLGCPPRPSNETRNRSATLVPSISQAPSAPSAPPTTSASGILSNCPVEGVGGDPDLNRLKNKTDSPKVISSVRVSDMLNWQVPSGIGRKKMSSWDDIQKSTVLQHQSMGVVVEGYVYGAKEEGPESPNCGEDDHDSHDFHVWFIGNIGDGREKSVVVEVTPRIRAQHRSWNVKTLNGFAKRNIRVRITGWVMLDPEHPDQVGKTRGTIWEVHPITMIEYLESNEWQVL